MTPKMAFFRRAKFFDTPKSLILQGFSRTGLVILMIENVSGQGVPSFPCDGMHSRHADKTGTPAKS